MNRDVIFACFRFHQQHRSREDALAYAQNRTAKAMARNLRVWDATADARKKAWAGQ